MVSILSVVCILLHIHWYGTTQPKGLRHSHSFNESLLITFTCALDSSSLTRLWSEDKWTITCTVSSMTDAVSLSHSLHCCCPAPVERSLSRIIYANKATVINTHRLTLREATAVSARLSMCVCVLTSCEFVFSLCTVVDHNISILNLVLSVDSNI